MSHYHSRPTYICDICTTTHKTRNSLKRHISHEHIEELKSEMESFVTGSSKSKIFAKLPTEALCCGTCENMFTNSVALGLHSITHNHFDLRYYCHLCEFREKSATEMVMHLMEHSREVPFQCKICWKTYTLSSQLTAHRCYKLVRTSHQQQERFYCSTCNIDYLTITALRSHNLKHHEATEIYEKPPNGKPYKCELCEKDFTWKKQLARHHLTHTGEKPFLCNYCGKTFATSCILNVHRKIHTGEKLHTCDICNKSFTQSASLKGHKRLHTGEKPFGCAVCGSKFTNKQTLKNHERIHTGERPYQCRFCERRFKWRRGIQFHEMTHTGEKPFACELCGKEFRSKSSCKSHEKQHMGEGAFSCPFCEEEFLHERGMDEHLSEGCPSVLE